MPKFSLIGILLTFTAICGGGETAIADDCALEQIASFNLQVGSDGTPLVPVTINGTPRLFQLHLGSGETVISKALVDELHLSQQGKPPGLRIHIEGQTADWVTVPEFRLGGIAGKDLPFSVVPKRWLTSNEASGALGLDILERYDLELNLAGKKMNLFRHAPCSDAGPYWSSTYGRMPMFLQISHNIILQMSLDGHVLYGSPNTVMTESVLRLSTAKRLFGLDAQSPGMAKIDTTAGPQRYHYPFKSLSVGDVTVQNPDVLIYEDKEPNHCLGGTKPLDLDDPNHEDLEAHFAEIRCSGDPDITLSREQLSKLRVYFAFQQHMAYVTPADSH